MIEHLIIDVLEADATLDTLLGSSSSDTKIYPDAAPQDTALPYIVYSVGLGILDETLDEDKIDFDIYSDSRITVASIRDRIKALLDLQDGIQDSITDTVYKVYYSKLTGGNSVIDTENNYYMMQMSFNIKYKKIT